MARADNRPVLYAFHKALNRPFPGTGELVSEALRLVGAHLPAERLSYFALESGELALRLSMRMSAGLRQEDEEAIHLPESSPLWRLVEGGRTALAYASPHPILYAPIRAGAGERAFGCLRLERPASKRTFTPGERRLAAQFGVELAQNLHQADVAHRGREQLKRLEALTELTAVFASSLRVEDGLKLILQGIQRHFALDRVRLYLVDRASQTLKGELSVDMRGQVKSLRSEEMPLTPGSHRFVDLLRGDSEREDLEPERYMRTVLHIPLTVQGAGIGLLVVDNLLSQQPVPAEDGGLLQSFAGQIALAVDNSRLFDEVQALSLYDSLTGLPVRRFFFERFQQEIYRAQRFGLPLSLALVDIDYYKEVNDTYGHQVGDALLKEIGRVIQGNLRKIDFPCRYGGDEVLILLPQSKEEDARGIMTRLAQQIREIRVPIPFSKAREVRVTASIGLAAFPSDGRTIEDLVQKADEALYWVKSHGKDGVAAFSQTKTTEAPS